MGRSVLRSTATSSRVKSAAKSIGVKNTNPSVAQMSGVQADVLRVGDVRVEDIMPGSIKDIHVGNLSADKITTGTLDVGLVTVTSDDGSMTFSGNIIAVNNGSGTRQVTIGKYDGTNYGIAFGPTPASPRVLIDGSKIQILATGVLDLRTGSDITLRNSGNSVSSLIGYIINNFVIQGDSTNGLNLYGAGANISLGETSGSYGGGNKVVFIPNASANPSSDPVAGGILYVSAGGLFWRGSAGTVTPVAPA